MPWFPQIFSSRSGVHSAEGRGFGQNRRLVRGELRESPPDIVRGCELPRQVNVDAVVARLGSVQAAVERGQLDVLRRLCEVLHTFAATRLDESAAQQQIDQTLGLRRAHESLESTRVWARALAPKGDITRIEQREHLLEMAEFLARDPRQRREQKAVLGILKQQAHRDACRLLLAVSVVEQQLGRVGERASCPTRVGRRCEIQHGVGSVAGRGRTGGTLPAVRYRNLGNSGLLVSEVGLGSWLTLGSRIDLAGTRVIVRRAFDLGVNFFDTADVYSEGAAEEALCAALADIPRRHLVIATKAFFPMSENPNDSGLSRKHLFESVEGSLRRLGSDYLDLHQCHRPDPNTPIEETVGAYEDLIRQGKLLYWGVSEWSAGDITDACRTADTRHAYRPISNQPQYSIMRRALEREVFATCEERGLGQVVFSPLGQGVLSGKYSGGARPEKSRAADDERNWFMDAYLEPSEVAKVDRLKPLAAELEITLPQLALAWCLRRPNVASVIVGVTRGSQLEENVGASGVSLPDDVLARIDEVFPGPVQERKTRRVSRDNPEVLVAKRPKRS
jgi:aryl-alcohol dehydrogenase-like predicted oxidoreductase